MVKGIDKFWKFRGLIEDFADIWFSGVKTDGGAMAEGVDFCGLVQTIHKGFCLATLENLMKYCPVGSYFVMEVTPRVPGGRPLLYIG